MRERETETERQTDIEGGTERDSSGISWDVALDKIASHFRVNDGQQKNRRSAYNHLTLLHKCFVSVPLYSLNVYVYFPRGL